jgi:hypothetical protein
VYPQFNILMRYLKSVSSIQYSNEVFKVAVSTIWYEDLSIYLLISCIILVINEVLQLTEVQSLVVNASHKVAPACNTTYSLHFSLTGPTELRS